MIDLEAVFYLHRKNYRRSGLRSYVGAGGLPRPGSGPKIAGKGAVTAPLRRTLGQVIAYFKYQSTKRINESRDMKGVPVWQRNYYEHIIRNEEELNRIREYIVNNPAQWELDEENPDREEKNVPPKRAFGLL